MTSGKAQFRVLTVSHNNVVTAVPCTQCTVGWEAGFLESSKILRPQARKCKASGRGCWWGWRNMSKQVHILRARNCSVLVTRWVRMDTNLH